MGKSIHDTKKILFLIAVLVYNAATAQSYYAGPPKGHLIVNGGELTAETIQRFVSLAGGPKATYIYVPSASTSIRLESGFIYTPSESNSDSALNEKKQFENALASLFGVEKFTVIHTTDRSKANTRGFTEALTKANGVWLGPGNAGRYANIFLGTLFQKELEGVLVRGGVVGGSSAGAIIQGSYIVRGRPDKPLLMAKGHEKGFGFLENVVINPHLTSAKRDNELVNVLDVYPNLLGIAIDDQVSLVFTNDTFEIIGKGIVAIYDNTLHDNKWWFLLKPGTSFNIRTRMTR